MLRSFIVITLLALFIVSFPALGITAESRKLSEFELENIADTPETREQYPFLVKPFDEVKASIKKRPEKQFGVYMAKLDKGTAGIAHDLFIVQTNAYLSCGTDGCPATIYEATSQNQHKEIFEAVIPRASSIYTSHCPEYTSVFLQKGHPDRLYWTEWKYIKGALEYTNPSYGNLDSIRPCGFKEAQAKSDNRIYTYAIDHMLNEVKSFIKQNSADDPTISEIVAKHIPLNRPKEEIFLALNSADFKIYQTNKKYFGRENKDFDEGYTASINFWIPRFIFSHEFRLLLYFNENKLAKIEGLVFLHTL